MSAVQADDVLLVADLTRASAVNLPFRVSPGQTRIFLRLPFEQTLDRNPELRVQALNHP